MEKSDQFRDLFRMQQALNERIGVKTDGMNEAERTKWTLLTKSSPNNVPGRKLR